MTVIPVLCGLLVLGLAVRAPVAAIGVSLVCCAASGIPWQLGAGNLAIPLWATLGLTGGLWLRERNSGAGRVRGTDCLPPQLKAAWLALVVLSFGSIAISMAVHGSEIVAGVRLEPGTLLQQLASFNPPPPARFITASMNWGAALLMFPSLAALLAATRVRRKIAVGAAVGGFLVIAAPGLEYVLGMPLRARPDAGQIFETGGLTGFSQDPHSYAALLILAGSYFLGLCAYEGREGRGLPAVAAGGLALLAFGQIPLTQSLGGVAAAITAILAIGALASSTSSMPALRRLGTAACLAALALMVAVVMAALAIVPGKATVYRVLTSNGYLHKTMVWRPFAPNGTLQGMLDERSMHMAHAGAVALRFPIWGVGPGALTGTETGGEHTAATRRPTENAHNAYLQVASELGVATASSWLVVLGIALAHGVRATIRMARQPHSAIRGALVGAIVGYIVLGLVSHPVMLPAVQLPHWLALAALACGNWKCPSPSSLSAS